MELLSLKWDYHCNVLQNSVKNLYGKVDYADSTLFCDGKLFKVHKIVLSACSDFFKNLFDQLVQSVNAPVIVLNDIKFNILEFILNYIYLGEVVIPSDELKSLVRAANLLQIKGLIANEDNIFHKLPIGLDQSQNAKEACVKESFPYCDEGNSFSRYGGVPQAPPLYRSHVDICDVTTNSLTDSNHSPMLFDIRIENVESLIHSGEKFKTTNDFARSFMHSITHEPEQKQLNGDHIRKGGNDLGLKECSKGQRYDESNLIALPSNQNVFTRYDGVVVHINDDTQINKTSSPMDVNGNTNLSIGKRPMVILDKGYSVDLLKSQFNATLIGSINSEESREEPRLSTNSENKGFEANEETISTKFLEDNDPKYKSKSTVSRKLHVSLKKLKNQKPLRRSLRESVPVTSMKVRNQILQITDTPTKRINAVTKRQRVRCKTDTPTKRINAVTKKRRVRCGVCEGCTASDCRNCIFCRDRYLKIHRLKQRCLFARCERLLTKVKEKNGRLTKEKAIIGKSAQSGSCLNGSHSSLNLKKKSRNKKSLESLTPRIEHKISPVIDSKVDCNSFVANTLLMDPSKLSEKAKIGSDVCSSTTNFSFNEENTREKIKSTIDSVLAKYPLKFDATIPCHSTLQKSALSLIDKRVIPCYNLDDNDDTAKMTPSSDDIKISSAINNDADTVTPSWRCYMCSKNFDSKMDLRVHLQTHVAPFACKLCNFSAVQNRALNLHIKMKHKHSQKRPYFCFICSVSFKTCSDLTIHNKSKHV